MLAPWVCEEMKTADLNNKRLNDRFLRLLSCFSAHSHS